MLNNKLKDICECCGGLDSQPILQLFSDKCFKVVEKKETYGSFCLGDFAFPVDGYNCIHLMINELSGEKIIFDNTQFLTSPSANLISDFLYARGILLKITYPNNDNNGEEVSILDKKVNLIIEDSEGSEVSINLYNFFAIFTNPKSNKAIDLINKIKVSNFNENINNIKISALILFGKAE
jgi:hypothetical protein